jgi:LytS/YehU family sensor histidine kinase
MDYNPFVDLKLYAFTALIIIALAVPFYIIYVSLPKILAREKQWFWLTLALGTIFIYPAASVILDDGFEGFTASNYVFTFIFLAMFCVLGALFRIFMDWITQRRITEKLEKQNLESELALLRTQINPHFLFNTLHNIDTLIAEDQKNASKALIRLSDIMRYMIHDTKQNLVPLKKEIEHIKNYISLEELRLKNPKFLTFNIEGDYEGIRIAPMLFISFIENAFKHSGDTGIESGLKIRFAMNKNQIRFTCENQYDETDFDKDNTKGIGLGTVKKRLNLLYPKKHELNIDRTGSNYKVELVISLDDN